MMMLMPSRLVALLAFTLALGGARMAPAADCHALKHLTWLLGSWRAEAAERVIREHWAPVSTESWEGFGETRAAAPGGGSEGDGAVLEQESLRLVEMAGEVFYIAKVGHNPLPIGFRLTQCGPSFAIFENPEHDFPRVIAYRLENDTLVAELTDGKAGGKGFTLRFKRDG